MSRGWGVEWWRGGGSAACGGEVGAVLEGDDGGDERRLEVGAGGGGGVEAGEGGAADAFCVARGGIDDALLDGEAAVADVCDGGPDGEGFVEVGGLEEVDVDVDNDGADVAHVGRRAAGDGREVVELGHVHECEVDVVVHVAQRVDVGEACLQADGVAEGVTGGGHAGVVGREKRRCDGHG